MKKLLLILLGIFALIAIKFYIQKQTKPLPQLQSYSSEIVDAYHQYLNQYGINFSDIDFEVYRLGVFASNYQKIQEHNILYQSGLSKYWMAINQFTILTTEEFESIYLGLKQKMIKSDYIHVNTGIYANSIDWDSQGKVQSVKDQGQCGSCWAFSAIAATESEDAIHKSMQLNSYSEQQLVDCSSSYGNQGCNGGLMDYAFQYIIDKGITTEDKYPYVAQDQPCQFDGGDMRLSKFTDVSQGDCDSLTNAVNQQPIAIGVDARNWSSYGGGVFNDCGQELDHGVLLVGYEDASAGPQWKAKNSWGSSWGEQGFIRLSPGNTCGICNTASYPSV